MNDDGSAGEDTGGGGRDSGGGEGGEACDNGLDDDSDGRVDEDCTCSPGAEQRCYVADPSFAGVGACVLGRQRCISDFEFGEWDICLGSGTPGDEVCDGVDNDCDGEVDEGCECRTDEERSCYSGPDGTADRGICRSGSEMCVLTTTGSEWGECMGEVLPDTEECDGVLDEDCDGRIDEGCTCALGDSRSCYSGPAGTEDVGECESGIQRCEGSGDDSEWGACSGVVTPRAEVCSGGRDEDCDGLTDCADPDCEASCCEPYNETLGVTPEDIELLFVVDRSGSMDWPSTSGGTRWMDLQSAMSTVLPMLSESALGMLTFPEMDGTVERNNCDVATSVDVPIDFGTAGTISARLVTVDPRAGDTPTPAAFATVQSYIDANPTSRNRFVILATDGLPEPNCGATVPATVSAISALRGSGVDTFVLGIVGPEPSGDTSGIPALQTALNQFADAGGRARAGATRYYEAVDGPALTSALEAIIAATTDCEFALTAPPERPDEVEVRQDGRVVPPAGYTIRGRALRFSGTYCDQIREGLVETISVSDDC